jgi:hypothetical protein
MITCIVLPVAFLIVVLTVLADYIYEYRKDLL